MDNTRPLFFVHIFCSTPEQTPLYPKAKKQKYRSRWLQGGVPSWLMGLDFFPSFSSLIHSVSATIELVLQGYKMAAAVAKKQHCPKAGREKEISLIHFSLYPKKFPLQVPLGRTGSHHHTLMSRRLRNWVLGFSASLGTRGRLCWQEIRVGKSLLGCQPKVPTFKHNGNTTFHYTHLSSHAKWPCLSRLAYLVRRKWICLKMLQAASKSLCDSLTTPSNWVLIQCFCVFLLWASGEFLIPSEAI